MLTPDVIESYAQAANVNITDAQAMLTNDLGEEARKGCVYQTESELVDGKLKLQ